MMMGLFRDCVPRPHPATPPVAALQQTHTQTLPSKYNIGKVTNTYRKDGIDRHLKRESIETKDNKVKEKLATCLGQ